MVGEGLKWGVDIGALAPHLEEDGIDGERMLTFDSLECRIGFYLLVK